MSANTKDRNTPESVYYYVQGLLKVEDTDDLYQIKKECVGVCYNYLNAKKQWSIYLENLMKLFLDLAFETQKYSKIKQILKNYRSSTQYQHPDSLKTILAYYRDQKLQQILNEQIFNQNINYIKQIKNIQDDQVTSQIVLSSFNLQAKSKKQWIKTNLKIVWDGYKAIADIIRQNHKMESVYLDTLKLVFAFVQRFNRKEQFKSFCQNQRRNGLTKILNLRKDKKDGQKTFQIDIQKEQTNTNYIEIRFQEFNLASKLQIWSQAQQTLSDIVKIMRVKKGPVKNILKCNYFEKLSFFWANAKFWHYHAYSFYNYYSIYITKSKLAASDKIKMADKLLLSVLCIPPSSLQRFASKQKNQKTAVIMMVPTNKILQKRQLQEIMISKGVVQNASPAVRQIWYFMFLEFDLTSLNKGLKLLQKIQRQGQYKQFIGLLQEILIYKQLISVAEVYQKMKYKSLLEIIPFPEQKIQRVLLECHNRKVIDFVLDKKQGLIIFEDHLQQTNPYEQYLSCYVDIALLHEESRKHDKQFIIKKAKQFMNTADDYYNNVRNYKIQQYKKKLKKPRQQLQEKQREKQKKLQQEKKNQQLLKKQKEAEQKKQNQQRMKLFIEKKVRIDEIVKTKQNRIVKIGDKRIQNLTDQQIKQMDKQIFQQGLRQITARVAADNENRNKKRFLKIDYTERERRQQLKEIIIKQLPGQQKQKQQFNKIIQLSKANYEEKQNLKAEIEKVAPEVKNKINQYYNESRQKYQDQIKNFKQNITQQFKKKVLIRARQLRVQAQNKNQQDQNRRRTQEITQSQDSWSIGKNLTSTAATSTSTEWKKKQKISQPTQPEVNNTTQKQINFKKAPVNDNWGRKGPITGITQSNAFSALKDQDQKKQTKKQKWNLGNKVNEDKKQQKKQQKEEKVWLGSKKVNDTQMTVNKTTQLNQKKQQKIQANKFIPPAVQNESKGAWGKGKANTNNTPNNVNNNVNTKPNQASRRDEPQLTFKGAGKKDDKKPITKGKGW